MRHPDRCVGGLLRQATSCRSHPSPQSRRPGIQPAQAGARFRPARLRRRFNQSVSTQAGIDLARSERHLNGALEFWVAHNGLLVQRIGWPRRRCSPRLEAPRSTEPTPVLRELADADRIHYIGSKHPSPSNVRMPKVIHTTRGWRSRSSTATSVMRTRAPGEAGNAVARRIAKHLLELRVRQAIQVVVLIEQKDATRQSHHEPDSSLSQRASLTQTAPRFNGSTTRRKSAPLCK
jgi:hypothetical protein